MKKLLSQTVWHDLFEAGIFFKALNSVWETLGGIFLLTRLHTWLTHIFVLVGKVQLLGDRDDFIFRAITTQTEHLSVVSTRNFVGLYLLFHGLANAFLAYNLFRKHLWSYPVMIGFISLFLVYQIYRLTHTHSVVLLGVTLFDIAFIILTWHEYTYQLKQKALQIDA